MRITVTFDEHGNIQCLKCPELAFLASLGPARHHRASHVVPVNRLLRGLFHTLRNFCTDDSPLAEFTRRWPCRWQADLALSDGPVLGPFARRKEAIAAEVAWVETNILGSGPYRHQPQTNSTDHVL
ncbi:MAG: hypothetical protein ACYC3X_29360 [Pirellulaceae bacterium]